MLINVAACFITVTLNLPCLQHPGKYLLLLSTFGEPIEGFSINTDAQITAQLCHCKVCVFSEVQQPIRGLSPRGPAAWRTQGCSWSMVVTLQWWQRSSQGRLWGLLRFPLGITEGWQLHPYVLGYPAVLREGKEPARESSSSSELPLVPHSSLFGDSSVV